jgi:hypothetical protein
MSDQSFDPHPWGYPLWSHLHNEHGLTLIESELAEIIRIARTIPIWEESQPDPLADHPQLF